MPPQIESSSPSDREIVNRRLIAAPRERVFRAFTDPAQLARWWGPKGFTNTIKQFDLRPGGRWSFTMHAPNGAEFHNETDFVEIAEPERIVFVHLGPVHRFQMTMTFSDRAGSTVLTWQMLFDSVDEATRIRSFIAEANEQNFDRLVAHLNTPS